MNRKLAYILIATMSLMILAGIALSLVNYYTNKGKAMEDTETTITIGDNTSYNREFNLGKLNPGDSVEYTIRLNAKNKSSVYVVSVNYEEIADHGLKHLVDVRLTVDGNVVFEGKLADLLKPETSFSLECEPSEEDSVVLHAVYYMSDAIGNEAMGTSADFGLNITSKAK